eukprot:CAMPEP_0206247600 /NCGR_PEP_ID=MMETSP0047_2-20121206/19902_1 /ASSEMBLY_ACC=CAM_ASM_000192 /TAXON_ID=195065 /ORGANISM="Chroomonas mesostigmatica_cf, Strain CCMP1168" /LENGTH=341 /DNA_ID=CAMNT_0053673147 /DNA_START=8 /DNA_END=1034 /DNA_ORIENTATION=+
MRENRDVRLALSFVAAICGLAAVAVMTSHSPRRVMMLRDPDEPTQKEMEFAGKHVKKDDALAKAMHSGEFSMPYIHLASQNRHLEEQVEGLQAELKGLLAKQPKHVGGVQLGHVAAPHGGAKKAKTQGLSEASALQGLSKRMAWAKEELSEIKKGGRGGTALSAQRHWQKQQLSAQHKHKMTKLQEGYDGEQETSGPWAIVKHNGGQDLAFTTPEGDDNPISKLEPGDYWKDPSEKPFLHAPYPHDPSSTLIHTVTGDYASPATWGQIYHTKQTIDWCVSYFPFFEDRMKCINKLHAEALSLAELCTNARISKSAPRLSRVHAPMGPRQDGAYEVRVRWCH